MHKPWFMIHIVLILALHFVSFYKNIKRPSIVNGHFGSDVLLYIYFRFTLNCIAIMNSHNIDNYMKRNKRKVVQSDTKAHYTKTIIIHLPIAKNKCLLY